MHVYVDNLHCQASNQRISSILSGRTKLSTKATKNTTATETIGDTSAMTAIGLRRNVSEKEISGSITCDGLVSSFSSLFGCMPITSFSQNVGLIAMTKVVNRFAIMTGAVIMIMAGLFPALGVLLASLPEPVLGDRY
jgi:xanthine/uracil permease